MSDSEPVAVFHLTDPARWEAAQTSGEIVPPGFVAEGFVHCSTGDQLAGTIERHFVGVDELVLLELDQARLGDALRWEESRPGEVYPHVYRAIELADVVRVIPWHR
jgi:uncharacterized protein (DUF952 family)